MDPSEGHTLCFVSWNVNGIRTNIGSIPKLSLITEELQRQHAQIVFLQETHIGSENYTALDGVDGWKCFFTVYDSQSKGVAILIRDDVEFQYICHDEDYSGGYLVLFCHLHNELFTLVNVYNHKHDTEILNRLQGYLRETAEGVLVLGGDFNTVLDLNFDRKSKSSEHKHTQLSDMFEKFTASLNLMDTWVHSNPTQREFTRSQNDTFSRLDMFLMPEDNIERVSNVTICNSGSDSNMENISDHRPVVLSLTLRKYSEKKMPKVASWLETYTYSRDESAAKINGEEILSGIKSIIDSNQLYPDGISMQSYKMHDSQMTEVLKISFNHLLYCKQIPDQFKMNTCMTGTRKLFNVDYLIFTTILAKRLRMLLLVHPEKKSQPNTDCYIVSFSAKPLQIKWTVLKEILTYLCEKWKEIKKEKNQPLRDFRILEAIGLTEDLGFWILDSILPKVNSIADDIRELQEGCSLTSTLCSLVLKYMEIHINMAGYDTHICHFRQVIVIHSPSQEPVGVSERLENITEMIITKMEHIVV